MGIRFQCPNCQGRLHVKTFLAGKQGICPKCSGPVRIPLEDEAPAPAAVREVAVPVGARNGGAVVAKQRSVPSAGSSRELAAAPTKANVSPGAAQKPRDVGPPASKPSSDVAADSKVAQVSSSPVSPQPVLPWDEDADAVWYVRPPSGGQFGPARGSVMRQWVAEGRVAEDAYVWREGWEDWRLFRDVVSGPTAASGATAPSPVATSAMPPAARAGNAAGLVGIEAPRAALAAAAEQRYLRRRRDRRGLWTLAVVLLTTTALVLVVLLGYVLQSGA